MTVRRLAEVLDSALWRMPNSPRPRRRASGDLRASGAAFAEVLDGCRRAAGALYAAGSALCWSCALWAAMILHARGGDSQGSVLRPPLDLEDPILARIDYGSCI
ncbi:MAG: hypothetical protein R3C42_04350 [Parvularculaceae bacterium]